MSIIVETPFQNFTGLDGKPLTNGKVYIGAVGTDPTVFANQIPVFWDEALTIPAAQPLTTSAGYIVRTGTPSRVYVATDYSISVKNASNVLVYYLAQFGVTDQASQEELDNLSNSLQIPDYATLRASTTPRKSVYITGIYGATFAGIAGWFLRDDADITSLDNGGTIIVRSDGVRYKRASVTRMNIQWFGAVPSVSINNTPMIQAAINAAKLAVVGIYIPSTTGIGYRFDAPLQLPENFVGITGDSIFFSTLNYTGTGTAISFVTTSDSLGVYADFQLQSGLPGETVATRRAVSRNGISWKCYGGQGQITNVKVFAFNGYGSLMEAIWDSRIEGLLIESCGGNNFFACGVVNGTDTSNHCVFTRLQVEDSRGNALYFEGLNMVMQGLHSERTEGNGSSFTHIIQGDVTLIDGRIQDTTNVRIKIGIATGSMTNFKCLSGSTTFEWGSRLAAAGRVQDCIFGDVIISGANLRHYDFSGGSMSSLTSSYPEKQTTLTGTTISGAVTLNGTGVRVNIYDGTVTGNIIQSAGGVNTVEAHDSDLAYFPTTQIARLYNCNVANTHLMPGGQKARSFNCTFSSEIVIQGNGSKWETQGCEYGNGATLGSGTPGWKFGKGDWVSSGAVSAGLLASPTSSSAAFANGEYSARILKTPGQPQGWFCTTAGVAPTLAFTSEGNL